MACALGLVGWGCCCCCCCGWHVWVRGTPQPVEDNVFGWGRSVVGCALRLVGWGWSGVVRARGFGVGGSGGYVAPA